MVGMVRISDKHENDKSSRETGKNKDKWELKKKQSSFHRKIVQQPNEIEF